ncbi:4-diphosphocytidyl-2-C-methyl-D-erythritol kinase [Bryocella elongata]|uniref:4-diphosphocytidyl-2-C-methyl-D-erythritol kinase n=1 Tax=Bryocella elongata TaxID=863522 RepID=A0A1H5XU31_9BACT|nr:4-(cytidine 5'-diphospho)-2-C-methyl-D-erythritol kinase [Bryocella elongata]SEG14947.1 4-diphosphocytidyl-2-C-methyl-D-erythritol kinase [Bryocella elongata]
MATRVRSFAKINLGLAVGPPRPDGFHALSTIYQTIGLHDFVTVSARQAAEMRITLTANHRGVPRTENGDAEKNTAWRMVSAALTRMGVTAEVHLDIDKRLPVQGGLGAGSANAVAALMGLERELGVALPGAERLRLAAEIGSDVPLFLLGGTVLGIGRGEEVYPLPDLGVAPCVVATPGVGVSTKQAFADLDARYPSAGSVAPSLTSSVENARITKLSCASAAVWACNGIAGNANGTAPHSSGTTPTVSPEHGFGISPSGEQFEGGLAENPLLALVRTGIENDFEEVVFSQHPFLRSTKRELLGSSSSQALYAALSGSGSALFGLYFSQAAAREAQQRVEHSGTRALLTEMLDRQTYFDTMFAE